MTCEGSTRRSSSSRPSPALARRGAEHVVASNPELRDPRRRRRQRDGRSPRRSSPARPRSRLRRRRSVRRARSSSPRARRRRPVLGRDPCRRGGYRAGTSAVPQSKTTIAPTRPMSSTIRETVWWYSGRASSTPACLVGRATTDDSDHVAVGSPLARHSATADRRSPTPTTARPATRPRSRCHRVRSARWQIVTHR